MPFVDTVLAIADVATPDLLRRLIEACELRAMRVKWHDASTHISELIDVSLAPEAVASAERRLAMTDDRQQSAEQVELPAKSLLTLLKRIALASKVDVLDAEGLLDKDKFDILATSTPLPVDEVLCMCDMYVHLNEIVGVLIVIDAALKGKIMHQHVIQEKAPRSFIVAKQLIDSLVQRLAVHANMYSSVDTPDRPWAVSLADVRRWLTGAKDFVQAARHKCIDALVDDLSDSSQGVLKMTPRFDHFITKTTCN
jgi:hypothetical protein